MKRLFAGVAGLLLSTAAMCATLAPIQLLSPAGSTSGQVIGSNGPSAAPSWRSVTFGILPTMAANTVLGNATGASATPSAVALPSCSTSNSALRYTSGSGFSCGSSFALTSSSLAQFAATTSLELAGVVSDETGSGALVFGTNPTISGAALSGGSINNMSVGLTTPLAGKFTTIQATGAITPSSTAGIVGTATNDTVAAGSVGEFVSNTTTGTSLTNSTTTNIASITLTAGDYDVSGVAQTVPAAGTTLSQCAVGISATSATLPTIASLTQYGFTSAAGIGSVLPSPNSKQRFPSSATVYLVLNCGVSGSTATANGFIRAERMR